jgi:hypothetical protein
MGSRARPVLGGEAVKRLLLALSGMGVVALVYGITVVAICSCLIAAGMLVVVLLERLGWAHTRRTRYVTNVGWIGLISYSVTNAIAHGRPREAIFGYAVLVVAFLSLWIEDERAAR